MRTLGVTTLLFAMVGVSTARAGSDPEPVKGPVIQVLELRGSYADHPAPDGIDPASILLGGQKQRSFFKLCDKIDALAKDDKTDVIYFDLSSPVGMNVAQIVEFSRHVRGLRAAGKTTIAWLENAGNAQYAIASSCEKIFMVDFGILDLPSLAMASLHFRDAMDLLGIRASVARVGDFKGATEPYTLSRMSDHLRQHYLQMLKTMNDAWVENLASGRGMAPEHVRSAQRARIFTARAAKEAGLVDVLVPHGGEREMVENLVGENAQWKKRMKKTTPPNFFELMTKIMGGGAQKRVTKPCIAVLHLDGPIIDGAKESPGSMVSGPTVEAIEELRKDKHVEGVVVRINSPGGSATASEAIRRALQRLSAEKRVVISMGSVAASGGYWITCIGKPIYAEATTITGSIGVLALKLYFGPLLNRIGLSYEDLTLDETASAMSPVRGWSDGELDRLQSFIDDVYDRFLAQVAESRGMDKAAVDAIGGGRVWSGRQAQSIGLVDHIGGVDNALSAIAGAIGLEAGYPVIHRPRHKALFELFDLFNSDEDVARRVDGLSLAALERVGFDVSGWLRLVLGHIDNRSPRIWLLAPIHFRVH